MSVMFSLRYVRRRQRHLRYRSMQRLCIVSMTSEKDRVCASSAELCLLHIVVSCVRWPVPHSFAKCHAMCQHVNMSTCCLVRQSFDTHSTMSATYSIPCNAPSGGRMCRPSPHLPAVLPWLPLCYGGVTMVTVVLRCGWLSCSSVF